jgi:hypothetical protein
LKKYGKIRHIGATIQAIEIIFSTIPITNFRFLIEACLETNIQMQTIVGIMSQYFHP